MALARTIFLGPAGAGALTPTRAASPAPAVSEPDAPYGPEEADYQAEPNEGQRCDGCQHWMDLEEVGYCRIVKGAEPQGWCKFHLPRGGEEEDQGEEGEPEEEKPAEPEPAPAEEEE